MEKVGNLLVRVSERREKVATRPEVVGARREWSENERAWKVNDGKRQVNARERARTLGTCVMHGRESQWHAWKWSVNEWKTMRFAE